MKKGRGFSLVELLVAIAIIGILAALLAMVLHRVKGKAGGSVCLNNLRQWTKAAHLYALDYREYLPPEGWANPPLVPTAAVHTNSWYVLLPEQLGNPSYYTLAWRTNAGENPGRSLWICPANGRRSNGNNLFHYCLNGLIDGSGATDRSIRLPLIQHPTTLVYLFDSKNLPAVHADLSRPGNFIHTNLHEAGAYFSFIDGHVARFPNSEYWDFAANRARDDHPAIRWVP
jgi:prepilin-type N-terminal cleavage/methylation domain-containing protein